MLSRYLMVLEAREALGLSLIEGLPDELPWPERATVWALEYHVETVDGQGRRRVRLAPAHEHDEGADPPAPGDVPEPVAEVWQALLGRPRWSTSPQRRTGNAAWTPYRT
jgi:hypothetical protein